MSAQEFEVRRIATGEVVGHIRTTAPWRPGDIVVAFRDGDLLVEPLVPEEVRLVPEETRPPAVAAAGGKRRR